VISSALIVDWCDEMVLEDSAHSAKVPPPNNLRLNEGEIEHLAPRMMLNVYWIYFTIIHQLSGNANRASGWGLLVLKICSNLFNRSPTSFWEAHIGLIPFLYWIEYDSYTRKYEGCQP
jgi:hypothetical protein